MKILNRIFQIMTVIFGIGSLVLFFAPYATFITESGEIVANGAQLAFKSTVGAYVMSRSSDITFCMLLAAIATISGVFSFKSKILRFTTSGVGLVAAIYMLVIRLSSPFKFVDTRPIPKVTAIEYSTFVTLIVIALFALVIFSVAYLLIDDKLEVAATEGKKLTIPQKVVRFLRDNKSEIKKIVWPGFKDVIKNTVIVLIMCAIIGALIWLIDFGLGSLLELILG